MIPILENFGPNIESASAKFWPCFTLDADSLGIERHTLKYEENTLPSKTESRLSEL